MYGEMAERLNAAVSKTVIPVTVSGVRIPLSPPYVILSEAKDPPRHWARIVFTEGILRFAQNDNYHDYRTERCPSGLRSTLGKRVYMKVYRGFESHSLRQLGRVERAKR